jgi:hypothetical protein
MARHGLGVNFRREIAEDLIVDPGSVVQGFFDLIEVRLHDDSGIMIKRREGCEPSASGTTLCECRFERRSLHKEPIDIMCPIRIVIVENQEGFHGLLGRLLAMIAGNIQDNRLSVGDCSCDDQIMQRLQ